MKKEEKRYMIVEYANSFDREYDTKEEKDKVLDDIRKYNRRKKSKYFCGNIDDQFVDGKYHLHIHLYKKLSSKNKISLLDEFTRRFNKTELQAYYEPQSVMLDGYEPDINIAYLETENATIDNPNPLKFGIKYIPVLYKDDLKYFDENYIKKCVAYHANKKDTGFFRTMAEEFRFHHVVEEEIERLYIICDKVDNQGYDGSELYHVALSLYRKLIVEREKDGSVTRDENGKYQISRRRLRDFAFFLKNYNARKKNSPLKYNGSTIRMMKNDLIRLRDSLLRREDIKKLELK